MENNVYERKDKRIGISFEASKDLRTYVYGDTIDELIDGIEMLANGYLTYEFFCKFPNLTKQQLKRLDKIMLDDLDNHPSVVFKYVCKRKEKLNYFEEFKDKFIKKDDKPFIYDLAKIFQDEDLIEAFLTPPFLENRLCEFVREFGDIYLQRIKNIIFDSKIKYQVNNICIILQDHNLLTPEDILIAEDILKETKNASYIRSFAEHIKGAHILELEEAFINSVGYLSSVEIFAFAHIAGADVEKLRTVMYKKGDLWDIKEFENEFGKKPKKSFNFFGKSKE